MPVHQHVDDKRTSPSDKKAGESLNRLYAHQVPDVQSCTLTCSGTRQRMIRGLVDRVHPSYIYSGALGSIIENPRPRCRLSRLTQAGQASTGGQTHLYGLFLRQLVCGLRSSTWTSHRDRTKKRQLAYRSKHGWRDDRFSLSRASHVVTNKHAGIDPGSALKCSPLVGARGFSMIHTSAQPG